VLSTFDYVSSSVDGDGGVIRARVCVQAGELWKQLMPAGGAGAAEDQDTILDRAKVRQPCLYLHLA